MAKVIDFETDKYRVKLKSNENNKWYWYDNEYQRMDSESFNASYFKKDDFEQLKEMCIELTEINEHIEEAIIVDHTGEELFTTKQKNYTA